MNALIIAAFLAATASAQQRVEVINQPEIPLWVTLTQPAVAIGGSTVAATQNGSYTVTPGTGVWITQSLASNDADSGKLWGVTTGVRTKVGATEEPVFMIVNLATSTKNLVLDKLYINSIDQGVNLLFRAYTLPIVTSSGTALSVYNSKVDVSSGYVAQVYFQPTLVSNGQERGVFQVRDTPIIDEIGRRFIITPGRRLLFTLESSGNNKKWAMTLSWIEE